MCVYHVRYTYCNQNVMRCEVVGSTHINMPLDIMHLSILCPTTPHPGYIGGKVEHLTCFDTKTCPICGEFDRLSYACATIKSTDDQIPHLFLDY